MLPEPELRRARQWIAALATVAIGISTGGAARANEEDGQLWNTVGVRIPLGERVSAGVEAQVRLADDVSEIERWVVTPSLAVKVAPWLAASVAYEAHLIENPDDTLEQRVWQQAVVFRSIGDVAAELRVRLEERWFETIDGVLVDTRLRMRMSHPIGSCGWYVAASNEVFVDFNSLDGGPQRGFDQNRLYAGLGRTLGGAIRVELGYQWQHVHRPGPSDDFDGHALLVGLSFSPR